MIHQGNLTSSLFNPLSKDSIEKILSGALSVLRNSGIVFHHENALEILRDAGCEVDKDRQLVKIPEKLAEESLKKCPNKVILKGPNGSSELSIGDPNVYFGSFAGKEYIDLDTHQQRPPTEDEFAAAWRVLDCLDGCHVPISTYGCVQGINGPYWWPYRAAVAARNTSRAGFSWVGGLQGAHKWMIRIFEVIGATPLGSCPATPPLTWHEDQINVLMDCAKAGIPIKPCSGLASGATAPATLAGALVQNCAEIISAIVLAQIIKPGLGIIVQDFSQPVNMRTGGVIQGGIERGLLGSAWCQIWRSLGIPRMTLMASDAIIPDYQCAMEKVMSATLHALAGSNIVNFMGTVFAELTFSPIVAIIDNDIVKMLIRVLNGINVNEETLAVDLINQVGPIPGQFLDKKHTREFWKDEHVIPSVVNRVSFSEWEKLGKKDILALAKEKYNKIIQSHIPNHLSIDQEREISELLKKSKDYFEKKHLL